MCLVHYYTMLDCLVKKFLTDWQMEKQNKTKQKNLHWLRFHNILAVQCVPTGIHDSIYELSRSIFSRKE